MEIKILVVIFSIGYFSNYGTAKSIPVGCSFKNQSLLDCGFANRNAPPIGSWPQVTTLILWYNDIYSLNISNFNGFDALESIYIDNNVITELDLDAFIRTEWLHYINAAHNRISLVMPLRQGFQLQFLDTIDFSDNFIAWLSSTTFMNIPKLKTLYLADNPLILPGLHPFLFVPSLKFLDLSRVLATGITFRTFSGLKELQTLDLQESDIENIDEVFSMKMNLRTLNLARNSIENVSLSNDFRYCTNLLFLTLSGNPLSNFNTENYRRQSYEEAVYDVQDTKLRCRTAIPLYTWAKSNRVVVLPRCEYVR